jgi:hypothetical protein
MTTGMVSNGRARKSLGDQIDRLDAILDGLSDALNDAVVQAVRQAVTVAVKAALSEVLAHPELRAGLAPAAAPVPRMSLLKRLLVVTRRMAGRTSGAIGRFGRWVVQAIRGLPTTIRRLAAACWRKTKSGCRRLLTAARRWPLAIWRVRGPVLMALSVGGAVAWGCYVAGPFIASAVGGCSRGVVGPGETATGPKDDNDRRREKVIS